MKMLLWNVQLTELVAGHCASGFSLKSRCLHQTHERNAVHSSLRLVEC